MVHLALWRLPEELSRGVEQFDAQVLAVDALAKGVCEALPQRLQVLWVDSAATAQDNPISHAMLHGCRDDLKAVAWFLVADKCCARCCASR